MRLCNDDDDDDVDDGGDCVDDDDAALPLVFDPSPTLNCSCRRRASRMSYQSAIQLLHVSHDRCMMLNEDA